MRFEWDDAKAAANLRKHWVGFDEAAEVFYDPGMVSDVDVEHSLTKRGFSPSGTRPGGCYSSPLPNDKAT